MALKDDLRRVSRYLVVIINFIFLALGVVIALVGWIGAYNKAEDIENSAVIFKDMRVKLVAALVTCTGILTVAISLVGILGAYLKNTGLLKIYAVVLFLVIAGQLAAGSYLISMDPTSLRDAWFLDTPQGEARRQEYQRYMECCGFEHITDSQPETECPGNHKISCIDATMDIIDEYLTPVAIAAVVIAVIELLSMSATCVIIATSGQKEDFYDNPFAY